MVKAVLREAMNLLPAQQRVLPLSIHTGKVKKDIIAYIAFTFDNGENSDIYLPLNIQC